MAVSKFCVSSTVLRAARASPGAAASAGRTQTLGGAEYVPQPLSKSLALKLLLSHSCAFLSGMHIWVLNFVKCSFPYLLTGSFLFSL